ncbi:MAG: DUF1997 domain-containing protein [Tychonema bourrellyi B0820]|uniref:DUF1997 domain-containing protein n=1 Tax=Tychonema bourrellyi FEM_GT703 TaxID=2040638 RepID=A0A2G4F5I6_9CYAN|nr:DUF1997 domain-containing protein [Tychonema bourrellyi]MDQ2097818.1 DUF1997 domain-containing protein [Tychonema bourrellyi B0820]PHX57063.1 DUF1997 domain-containing protein [Tychonema bourrellyi FEM_GT703]
MKQDSAEYPTIEASDEICYPDGSFQPPETGGADVAEDVELIWFSTHFEDSMEMYADAATVAEHLNNHKTWFCQCALPMKAEPIGENGYDLLIGRFGAFGYRVEARIGLELLPPDAEGCYLIKTIPVPNYTPPGYEVNFCSAMNLMELSADDFAKNWSISDRSQLPPLITIAGWKLDLAVGVYFPKFIRSMSKSLIQKTGEGILEKIIKQVNRRLTYKTQLVFHESLGIPFPKKPHKHG